ncbi:MAG: rhodanese-like domain-containing protein [Anaerolineae bacterium]|nr:rhodanese-like domain-containing protein [Anaerolineae bacterium]
MLFTKIESKGLAQYSYIIGDGYDCVVIDPRRDCQIYRDIAFKAGMRIRHILETHRHEDFVVGSAGLASLTGAEIWHADSQLPYQYGKSVLPGQRWHIGGLVLEALHTPGHTEGSRSYILFTQDGSPWMAFTGDVLFTGEVGRVDFLGMDYAPIMAGYLYDSIYHQLLPYGDGVILCPAHGYGSACGSDIADRPWSTLGIERITNPRMQFETRDDFVNAVVRKLPKPGYFSKMEELNLQGPSPAQDASGIVPLSPQDFRDLSQHATIIDLRSISAFAGGHIPGALSLITANLPGYVGWFVQPDESILLVSDNGPDDIATAVTYLYRQGYDNILGYLSENMLDWIVANYPVEQTKLQSPYELAEDLKKPVKPALIDVRSAEEYAEGVLPDAIFIPLKGFMEHLDTLPVDQNMVMYCAAGTRSIATISAVQRAGFKNVSMLNGGLMAWDEAFKR